MKRSPAFQFYPDKWISHTRRLSDSAYRVYHELICWMWEQSPDYCSIEADLAAVSCAIARPEQCVTDAFAEIQNAFAPLLKLENGRWVSNGLRKCAEHQEYRRDVARQAAEKRHHKNNADASEKDANASESDADASFLTCTPTPTPTPTKNIKIKLHSLKSETDCQGDEKPAKVYPPEIDKPAMISFVGKVHSWIAAEHPHAEIPAEGSAKHRGARMVIYNLVKKDGFSWEDVVDALTWVFHDEPQPDLSTDFSWRRQTRSILRLRDKCKNDMTKFANIHAAFNAWIETPDGKAACA